MLALSGLLGSGSATQWRRVSPADRRRVGAWNLLLSDRAKADTPPGSVIAWMSTSFTLAAMPL
jgi:hypothetical protein